MKINDLIWFWFDFLQMHWKACRGPQLYSSPGEAGTQTPCSHCQMQSDCPPHCIWCKREMSTHCYIERTLVTCLSWSWPLITPRPPHYMRPDQWDLTCCHWPPGHPIVHPQGGHRWWWSHAWLPSAQSYQSHTPTSQNTPLLHPT